MFVVSSFAFVYCTFSSHSAGNNDNDNNEDVIVFLLFVVVQSKTTVKDFAKGLVDSAPFALLYPVKVVLRIYYTWSNLEQIWVTFFFCNF